jgi:hypothetical protein
VTAHPPPDADTLACALAGRYAGRWARSAARLADGAAAPWFVDGFAGADLQRAALRSVSAQPAAVAALQALDAAAEGARIVLVEEDPGLVVRLVEELHGVGAGARVRVAADPAAAAPGEIALVEAPFAAVAARLAEAIGGAPALVRLAPLTARTLPWPALQAVAALPATDVLLRFPHEDFAKQARFTGPLADLPPHLRRLVEGCSALLGDARHGWIARWRAAERDGGADAALGAMVDRLHDMLMDVDDPRYVHTSRVDGAPAPVHLLLSTADPKRTLDLDDDSDEDDIPVHDGVVVDVVTGQDVAGDAVTEDPPIPEPSLLEDQTPQEPPTPIEPPATLDLFAALEELDQESAVPSRRRPATPRQRKPRTPAAEEPDLFDEPEE